MGEVSRIRTGASAWALVLLGFMNFSTGWCVEGVGIGDRVSIHYTCRIKGEIAATTSEEEIERPGAAVSPVFLPRKAYEPKEVMAAPSDQRGRRWNAMTFEGEILRGLAGAVAGMRPGETRRFGLSASLAPDVPENERFVNLRKAIQRPKRIEIERGRYTQVTGMKGEAGEKCVLEGIRGEVLSLEGDKVHIALVLEKGDEIPTAFGMARVTAEYDDHFELKIDARLGSLVRAGPLVARIVKVDEDMMTLDFGHPFGWESLDCDLTVASIVKSEGTGPNGVSGMNSAVPLTRPDEAKTIASPPDPAIREGAGEAIQDGDIVLLDYSVTFEDGTLLRTTLRSVAQDAKRERSTLYEPPPLLAPEAILAGQDKHFPGLAKALLGLTPGEHRGLRIEPKEAYGLRETSHMVPYPRHRTIPRFHLMAISEFRERFGSLPEVGAVVPLIAYLKAEVTDIGEEAVSLQVILQEKEESHEAFGRTVMESKGDSIETLLYPVEGATFYDSGRQGRIAGFDEDTFIVDYNHPLAGKALILDIHIHSVTRASAVKSMSIDWITDHAEAVTKASADHKEMVVMLYTPSCHWSRRFGEEVLEDPRIRMLHERFVWSKVNADQDRGLVEFYEVKSYPTLLVLKPDGEVKQRLEGFRNAGRFYQELTAEMTSARMEQPQVLQYSLDTRSE